jgi:hypothetical protein
MMQNRKFATLAAAALALALPLAAAAQATPEQVATQYLQSMKAGDWAANASLVHPAEEDSLKAAILDVSTSDTSTAGLRQIFNVGSAAELRALPAQQVYQRFVAGTVGGQPGMRELLNAATFSVMGHVTAGDTAYVVYRVSAVQNGQALSQVTVLSLRRDGTGWKARLPEEVKGLIIGMHTAAAQRRAANSALTPNPNAGQAQPARPTAPPPAPAPAPPPARP